MRTSSATSFFEKYAHEYDFMTNASERRKYHDREVASLVARFEPDSVLDAGCATGLTASLFARRGIGTVGLDRSRKMLAEADRKYGHLSLPLKFRYGHFERLPMVLNSKFDLVVSLANSISGLGDTRSLARAMSGFRRILRPGGTAVIQMLNYTGWTEGEMRPIRLTRSKGITYIRFCEREGTRFHIYVLRVDRKGQANFEVFRHSFDCFTPAQLKDILRKSGFESVKQYGNLHFDKKFTRKSRDLVVVASLNK